MAADARTVAGSSAGAPRIWLIVGDRPGDNAQAEELADAVGLHYTRKYVRVREAWRQRKPRVRPTLHHLELAGSDPLEPPWPDLIITVGRRLSMVALWIREQAEGHTRIVLVGKPSGSPRPYDLIVTSSIVQIPPAANVVSTPLPLLRVDRAAIAAAGERWRERMERLPRPIVGILVGGPTNPFVFNRRVEADLLELARGVVAEGGTPWVTTSPRTPPATVQALADGLPEQARFFEWRRDAADNPYRALLALADGFVVTGDSISMLVEVARMGKPLAIYALPYGPLGKLDQLRRSGARWLYGGNGGRSERFRRLLRALGGPLRLLPKTRDFTAIHGLLIERGLAVPAGEPLRPPTGEVPDDLGEIVGRIRSLALEAGRPGR